MQAPFSYLPAGYYYVRQGSAGIPYVPAPVYPYTPVTFQILINSTSLPYVPSAALLQAAPSTKEEVHNKLEVIPRRRTYGNPWVAFRSSTPGEKKRSSMRLRAFQRTRQIECGITRAKPRQQRSRPPYTRPTSLEVLSTATLLSDGSSSHSCRCSFTRLKDTKEPGAQTP